jgi:hypothetical protein
MIGSKYFATNMVRNLDFVGVGIYNYLAVTPKNNKKNGILLSCGKSKKGIRLFEKEIIKLRDIILLQNNDINFYIEPDFFHFFNKIPYCHAADYSIKMYREINSTVIRPGIGTLSDAICIKARIYAVIESGNEEIKNNAETIVRLGIGEMFNCYSDGLIQAIKNSEKLSEFNNYENSKIETDGIGITVKELEKFFNNH